MKFLGTMMLLSLLSCGRAPEMKMPGKNSGKAYEALTGKEQNEILSLKYNNNVQLNCTLHLSDSSETLSWDMPGDASLLKIMNFHLGEDPFVVVVKISEPLKVLDQISYTSPDGREYFMEHTPVVKIYYRRGPKSILTNGSVHKREAFKEVSLFENVETRLEYRSTEVDGELMREDLRCKLATKINSPYLHQWKIVK